MPLYLVCFDITDDHNRYQIGVELEAYGVRVQRSVFEVELVDTERGALQQRLMQYVDAGDDVRFYHLCVSCCARSQTVGGDPIAELPLGIVL